MEITIGLKKVGHKDFLNFLIANSLERHGIWLPEQKESLQNYFINKSIELNKDEEIFIIHSSNEILASLKCAFLDWDTKFYGFNSFNIDNIVVNRLIDRYSQNKVLTKLFEYLNEYLYKNNAQFSSLKINNCESNIISIAQNFYYKFILTWHEGFLKTDKLNKNNKIVGNFGPIKEEEVDFFSKLACKSYYSGGRFYSDPYFNNNKVNEMYESLVKSSYKNKDIMLVYRYENDPAGLFICKSIQEIKLNTIIKIAPLRFLLVDTKFREKGIGINIFKETLNYLKKISDIITTGLESHNLKSLNIHNKFGFKYNYTYSVFHKWHKR